MNKRNGISPLLFILVALFLVVNTVFPQTQPWVSGYYAGWMVKFCSPSEIDYTALTHVIHFSAAPNSDGTINGSINGLWGQSDYEATTIDLIARTHNAGKKVILSLGGWYTESSWVGAVSSANVDKFLNNIMYEVQRWGYDGVDIDWEPLDNKTAFVGFIPKLRAKLDSVNPDYLLTVPCYPPSGYNHFATIHGMIDQINIMTYDMSGPWPGWVAWHNSPLYNGGYTFPSTGGPLPSSALEVTRLAQYAPMEKIGIGICFYGWIWHGVYQPRQDLSTYTSLQANIPYFELMNTYGTSNRQYDYGAEAPYLSYDLSGTSNDLFIPYEDAQSIAAKVSYIKSNIGGMIIWELAGGYERGATVPDVLLQAVKNAVGGITAVTDGTTVVPETIELGQNYPNPFNPTTEIQYQIVEEAFVSLTIYNLLGEVIEVLVSGTQSAGIHRIRFDGHNLPSGVYVYTLQVNGVILSNRMMVLK